MSKTFRPIATWFAVLLACLSVTAPARQTRPATRAAIPVAPLAMPALWKISDADTTIYLFGTIHLLPKGLRWFAGPIETAFNSSQEFVSEIGETDPARVQAVMVEKAFLPPDKSLRGLLSPSEKAELEKALSGNKLAPDSLDRFEPWYAGVYLSTVPLLDAGYSAANGVEATLEAKAKVLKQRRVGLETIEYQLGLFDTLPADVQRNYLVEIAKHSPTIRAQLTEMVEQWKRGNAEKLAELMNADEDDPHMVEVLLTGRNRAWAKWIKERMDEPGKIFLAVGTGHLAGKDSVLEQLKTLGFTVTRLQ
jgi:uncharacterized protein YbaP (TraB family)